MNSTQWSNFELPKLLAAALWSKLGKVNVRVLPLAAATRQLPLVVVYYKPSRCLCPPCRTLVTRKHTNSSGWMSFGSNAAVATEGLHEVVISLPGFHTEVVHVHVLAQRSQDVHVQLKAATPAEQK